MPRTVMLYEDNGEICVRCLICDGSIPVKIGDSHIQVCKDCKDAIKYMKRKLRKKKEHALLSEQNDFSDES